MGKQKKPRRNDQIHRLLRKAEATIQREADQKLTFVRTEYERLDNAERKRLRAWVGRIADLERPGVPVYASVKIHVLDPDEKGAGEGIFPPELLKRAFKAWDKRGNYPPGAFEAI